MINNLYMHRALQLAKNGLGSVSPNPMAGCVIAHNDIVIGEGWHQQFGEAHAEVNAINSVKNKKLLKDATVYVTLEPCSFVGKTPACSDLLINSKVKKVVVATLDPNPKVAGSGVAALKNEG
ncbi:MAG: bifunctional diaminohydroxyphosphoribosylaminopyrimidine deaminase/5-amino-6-(5-phosphoribosylamino)uracil reductase RibD, partial [Cyclobacteriaceae bacterium]|nr:bifunctional diaminohydroxyphosphoribosylaminopyrimidine deaminase/5-amino-6-(5-phosphoribosylamino)uracil reductase RibD [Cyclobacteriaceae bacterium]